MARRSQRAKRAVGRANRDRDRRFDDEQTYGRYVPPLRSECAERSFYLPDDGDGTVQVSVMIWTSNGRIADSHLSAEQLQLASGSWVWAPIARVDICHGHAHVHDLVGVHVDDAPRHLLRVDTVDDVQTAYHRASAEIVRIARRLAIEGGQPDGD